MLKNFQKSSHYRHWWYKRNGCDYEPLFISLLNQEEKDILNDWFNDTERKNLIGEMGVPLMSLITGLVMGNGIRSILQLGHYAGFSTIVTGFLLRKMGGKRKIVSVDIDVEVTDYVQKWVDMAKLNEQVTLIKGSSTDIHVVNDVCSVLQGKPEVIVIDSSHQYKHTLKEISLWFEKLKDLGFLVLHDTSHFAQDWDKSNEGGGVLRALDEWKNKNPRVELININHRVTKETSANELVYQDGCGVGIIQK